MISVLPEGFAFPFVGGCLAAAADGAGDGLETHALGRLAPGVSLAQAREDIETLAQRLGAELEDQRDHRQLLALPSKQRFVNEITARFLWMMRAIGVLLLPLACVNMGNLQFVQSLIRHREPPLRSVLGASRPSLLLSLLATATGLVLAHFGGQWAMAVLFANEDVPVDFVRFDVDAWMVGFGLAAAFVTTLLLGLWPALRGSRGNLQDALRDGDKGSGGLFARVARPGGHQ